jgi:hypothetical protein
VHSNNALELLRSIAEADNHDSITIDSGAVCEARAIVRIGESSQGEVMSRTMQVYEPVAPCLTQARQAPQSLDRLSGKVIGFIDNSKPNFNYLVEDLSQILTEKHGVKRVIQRRKRSASQGAPDAVMNELVEQADAIITGSGD